MVTDSAPWLAISLPPSTPPVPLSEFLGPPSEFWDPPRSSWDPPWSYWPCISIGTSEDPPTPFSHSSKLS